MKMNKQELMTNVNEILDKHLGNTIFTDPVLSITKSAKDNRILMGLEFEQGGIVLEKELFKLKDVIARIKDFDSSTQKVWLNEILNELGSDYGSLKYRAGYEQGKFDCAVERENVMITQDVADYIEYAKEYDWDLQEAMDGIAYEDDNELRKWFNNNIDTFARAWLDGYTVKKEKRYIVKVKGISAVNGCLKCDVDNSKWFFSGPEESDRYRAKHTIKELDNAGFGWVFDCEGIELEEVEE